jgi:hypothetical protein
MKTVELHPAFFWICDDCGLTNFEHARRVDPQSDEARELDEVIARLKSDANEVAEEFGAELGGDWVEAPTRVQCLKCESEYRTEEV